MLQSRWSRVMDGVSTAVGLAVIGIVLYCVSVWVVSPIRFEALHLGSLATVVVRALLLGSLLSAGCTVLSVLDRKPKCSLGCGDDTLKLALCRVLVFSSVILLFSLINWWIFWQFVRPYYVLAY